MADFNAYFRMINGNRGSSYNIGMWNCRKGLVNGENKVQHSPETKGNVRSTLVPYKKIPEYSHLADETYLNLKPIYMRKNVFYGFSIFSFFGTFFGLKT